MHPKTIQLLTFIILFTVGLLAIPNPVNFGIIFIPGLIILVNGADYLVDSASKLAKKFGISPLIIGLTIVAFGTSFSELAVSTLASFFGSPGISIGNVIGSNILNIALILGITALIYPLSVKSSTIKRETPFMILAGIFMIILSLNFLDFTGDQFVIGRIDGLILILLFVGFIFYLFRTAKKQRRRKKKPGKKVKENTLRLIAVIVLGFAGILLGAQMLIYSSVGIAAYFGISETIIGLTIVAIGTSLPELATNIAAALKKEADIAVGNIVGSNISNTLLVLGAAALINPIPVAMGMIMLDMAAMMILFILLMVLITTGQKLEKKEGIVLLTFYLVYAGYLVISVMA